jgi:hypothetical protein
MSKFVDKGDYLMKNIILYSLLFVILVFIPFITIYSASYEYDSYDRLIKVTYENGDYIEYTYDSGGNILSVNKYENSNSNPDDVNNSVDNGSNNTINDTVDTISNNDYNSISNDSENSIDSVINPDSGNDSNVNNTIDEDNGDDSSDSSLYDNSKIDNSDDISEEDLSMTDYEDGGNNTDSGGFWAWIKKILMSIWNFIKKVFAWVVSLF